MLKQYGDPVVQSIELDDTSNPMGVELYIKREDLIHPEVSGNKWRKLKYSLIQAEQTGQDTLLTFGGAYSNHIYALAAAARELGMRSIGIIRGEAHLPYNPTLQYALDQGMVLKHVSRKCYRNKNTREFELQLQHEFGRFYLLPEGGTSALAIKGASEIVAGHAEDYDLFVVPVGTGGTLSGVVSGLNTRSRALGIAVLKGCFLQKEVNRQLQDAGLSHLNNFDINTQYAFGGYARYSDGLVRFINQFRDRYGIWDAGRNIDVLERALGLQVELVAGAW
ncbi:MAG: pyridoxal-phosphate dependent enzyme, partial [Gammaproteobacteria bacterium]|nr:pyridoxal-phosphate dependent enzyme [Gammaproteobacteria bacterium]